MTLHPIFRLQDDMKTRSLEGVHHRVRLAKSVILRFSDKSVLPGIHLRCRVSLQSLLKAQEQYRMAKGPTGETFLHGSRYNS